jgi:CRP/FNR family transcriptional regulator
MASAGISQAPRKALEDPLAYLPCSSILEYSRGQVIYDRQRPSAAIHLVLGGRVKVALLNEDGHQVVVDIYGADDFFGESAFLGLPNRIEQASALDNAKLMAWSASEIEQIIEKRPRLAVALIQILVQRTVEYAGRIESLSVDDIAHRLARTLIRFSERLGSVEEDGAFRLMPFTHELLSQYVGTSREIVTLYMNQFRRQGYLRYSRQGIVLYRDALNNWLRESP